MTAIPHSTASRPVRNVFSAERMMLESERQQKLYGQETTLSLMLRQGARAVSLVPEQVSCCWITTPDEGEALLRLPLRMGPESLSDLREWLLLIVGQLEKRQATSPSGDPSPPVNTEAVK